MCIQNLPSVEKLLIAAGAKPRYTDVTHMEAATFSRSSKTRSRFPTGSQVQLTVFSLRVYAQCNNPFVPRRVFSTDTLASLLIHVLCNGLGHPRLNPSVSIIAKIRRIHLNSQDIRRQWQSANCVRQFRSAVQTVLLVFLRTSGQTSNSQYPAYLGLTVMPCRLFSMLEPPAAVFERSMINVTTCGT